MPRSDTALTTETHPAQRLNTETVAQVMDLGASSDGVLSVYIDIDPAQAQREGFEAAALDLWKPLRAEVTDPDVSKRLEDEIDRVNGYVRSWDEPPGRSVAIFSSRPADVFVPVALAVPTLAGARFGPRPHVLPLIAALDEHERYVVALVDRERARILTVWMGEVELRSEFEDPLPGRVTRGGGWATGPGQHAGRDGAPAGGGRIHSSQGSYARHIDWHVHEHIQRVIAELWRLSRESGATRIIIGGPHEALSTLKRSLPRSLAERVAGEFAGELLATDADVIGRVRGMAEQAERAHEAALVAEVLQRTQKNELAVTGWDETLSALADGRAHEVLLIEGETAVGSACPEGHFAATEGIERCPYCDEPMWEVADLAAWALRRAFATDAQVEFVRGEAAEMLRPFGAAAILRYQG